MDVKVGDGVENGFTIVGDNAGNLSKSQKFWRWFDMTYSSRSVKIRRIEEKWSWWRNKELVFALFYITYLDEAKEQKSKSI